MSTGSVAEERLETFFSVLLEELNGVHPKSPEGQFARDRQVQRARKRARFSNEALKRTSIDSFLRTNCLVGSTDFSVDRQIVLDARHFITEALERATRKYDEEEIQNPLSFSYLFDNWRFGPGASNGIRGTHAAEKIAQSMTCTLLSVPLVRHLRRSNTYFQLYDELHGNDGVRVVRGSRLELVLKNQETMRGIAIEPSGNMVLQLAAGRILEDALRIVGLDISWQQFRNKLLALSGSVDGRIATLDLKDASNMITLRFPRALMPSKWTWLLEHLRSPEIYIEGEWIRLNMMSTMGNGFTFPLMTLLIVGLIYGYRAQKRGSPNLYLDWSQTCVFGDDIIVPTHEYTDICEILSQAGLVVNHDKSYSSGPFRESCGGDYYKGVDVTPFYVKSLSTNAEIFTAINQLLEWSAKTNIDAFRSLNFLKGLLKCKAYLVPEWMNPDQGIRTASCSRKFTYLSTRQEKSILMKGDFSMMLACGGYLSELKPGDFVSGIGPIKSRNRERYLTSGGHSVLTYVPRPFKTSYVTRTSRLPHGYLDGRDPLTRSQATSSYIDMVADIMFNSQSYTSH